METLNLDGFDGFDALMTSTYKHMPFSEETIVISHTRKELQQFVEYYAHPRSRPWPWIISVEVKVFL